MESDVKETSESSVNTPETSEVIHPEGKTVPPTVEMPSPEVKVESPEVKVPPPEIEVVPTVAKEISPEVKPILPEVDLPPPEIELSPPETEFPSPAVALPLPEVELPLSEVVSPPVKVESPPDKVESPPLTVSPSEVSVVPPSKVSEIPPSEVSEVPPSKVSEVPPPEAFEVPSPEACEVPPLEKEEKSTKEKESKNPSISTEKQSNSSENQSSVSSNPTSSTEKPDGPVNSGPSSAKQADIAINGLVAKVHLDRCNFDDILNKEEEPKPQGELTPKTKIDKAKEPKPVTKQHEFSQHGEKRKLSDTAVSSSVVVKRKRGRPPKKIKPEEEVDASAESEAESVTPVPQQPKLVRKRGRPRKIHVEKSGSDTESKPPAKRFNGEKVSTSRIIKPNTRLQDFVVSSSVRYYTQSAIKLRQGKSEQVTEDVVKPTVSGGNKKSSVRSFLPVFDGSGYSDDTDDEVKVKDSKEKENQVDNIPAKRRAKTEDIDYSPKPTPKVMTRPRILAMRTPRLVGNLQRDKLNGSSVKQIKSNIRGTLVTYKQKTNDIDFDELVRSLKLVKLPGPNWKIRIVVSKQQTITEVTFTNKQAFERCVKFSRTVPGHSITFGKSIVRLLGSPPEVVTHDDVTVLLDIVHNLAVDDPVLEYNTRCV